MITAMAIVGIVCGCGMIAASAVTYFINTERGHLDADPMEHQPGPPEWDYPNER